MAIVCSEITRLRALLPFVQNIVWGMRRKVFPWIFQAHKRVAHKSQFWYSTQPQVSQQAKMWRHQKWIFRSTKVNTFLWSSTVDISFHNTNGTALLHGWAPSDSLGKNLKSVFGKSCTLSDRNGVISCVRGTAPRKKRPVENLGFRSWQAAMAAHLARSE